MPKVKATTVDEYVDSAPIEARGYLLELIALLKEAAPTATIALKWGLPVFEEKRILFSLSAYKNHINFMPTGQSLKPFLSELADFKLGEHTIQLPYNEPIPADLIRRIAEHRVLDVRENDAKWMYR